MKLSLRAKNFVAALMSNFGVQGLRFFTMTLLARRLGLDLFGAYNYILLLLSYGFVVVEFGLRNVGIREMAHGRGSRALVGHIGRIRLGLALIATVVVAALTHSAFPKSHFGSPSLFLGASLFMDALLLDYVLVAEEALVPQAVGNLIQAAFLFAACFVAVRGERDFLLLSQFYFFSHFLWILVVALAARKYLKKNLKPSSLTDEGLGQIALKGAPFMVATLTTGVLSSLDLLLLGQFHYDNWLGNYSAALKILGIALGIINSLLASVQPRFAKQSAHLRDPDTVELVDSTTRFLWTFVAPTVLGAWFFGDQLVIWIFGSAFAGAGPLLKPLSLAFAFLTLSMGPLHLISVSHNTKDLLRIVFSNFVIGVLAVGGVLFMGHPELVAWAMALVQACYLISAWGWYGIWRILKIEDLQFFALPLLLLLVPLLLQISAPVKFTLAALGYLTGIGLMGVWKRTWFVRVLGRS